MLAEKFPAELTPEKLAEKIQKLLQGIEFNSFSLGVCCQEEKKEEIRKPLQAETLKLLEKETGQAIEFNQPEVYILLDFLKKEIQIQLKPVYFKGRYNKFDRAIAQTIHYCFKCKGKGCQHCQFTGKTTEHSLQEIIAAEAEKLFQAQGNKFHGQGREDVDVLMLGSGRPFVLELIEPKKRKVDLKLLEKKINQDKKIKVHALVFSNKKEMVELKNFLPDKTYQAVVECRQKISENDLKKLAGQSFDIIQRTPLRVAKRRADLARKKQARFFDFKKISEKTFSFKVQASAGLYIKELISGDQKRTEPSLTSLLDQDCLCAQLDVLELKKK